MTTKSRSKGTTKPIWEILDTIRSRNSVMLIQINSNSDRIQLVQNLNNRHYRKDSIYIQLDKQTLSRIIPELRRALEILK